MPSGFVRRVICYDIRDDKRRRQVVRCLEGYGDRVQYSVFEALLDEKLFDTLITDVREIIDPKEDRVSVYMVCGSCESRRSDLGTSEGMLIPGDEIVFVV